MPPSTLVRRMRNYRCGRGNLPSFQATLYGSCVECRVLTFRNTGPALLWDSCRDLHFCSRDGQCPRRVASHSTHAMGQHLFWRRRRIAGQMETFTYILTAMLAIALVGAGIYLCVRKVPAHTPTIAAVLSIAFLMLLLLQMSKFKHVQGFGFDAETWDEKQVQAAQLVDQLSTISEGLSQQVALLAARSGFWGSGLSNPELARLLRQTDEELQLTKTPDAKRAEILAPIRLRISTNYWNAARNLIDTMYQDKRKEVQNKPQQNPSAAQSVQTQVNALTVEVAKIDAIQAPGQILFDLDALVDRVKNSKTLTPLPQTALRELTDLSDDLWFFNANKDNKLKRDIDLDKLYPSPHGFITY